ncbi:MAG: methyltransferase domain-containing protein [Bacteroidales bacterium]|nr:methyltransferase domain-containing protein [Bacteroidales bacterium]
MKRSELFHPIVFSEQEWADGYYKRNARNIAMTGKRLAGILNKSGFNGGKILDVGCGFAAVPIEIAKVFRDVEIIGIDLADPLLMLGDTLVEKAGFKNKITLLNGDAQNIQFDTDSFDVIINSYLVHIIENPVTMLNEIERVAKPDAKIIITDLRRGLLALFFKKFKTALTLEEAKDLFIKSEIRNGNFSNGPFWWDYVTGL